MTDPAAQAYVIRPALATDIPRINQLIEPFVQQGKLLRRTSEELDLLLPNTFVAELDNQIVGCAVLEIYSRKLAEIRSLAVRHDMQQHGIGKALVQACLARAQEQRILEVLAITSAESFFLSCGFNFTLPGEKKALFHQFNENA